MSERLRIERELLCAILKFETLKTIKLDSMDEQAGLGLGFAIIQSNFNGSNTFGTMKISSRQG